MTPRRGYRARKDDSMHRFKIRSELPMILFPSFTAFAILSIGGYLSFNVGWIWIVFGILVWIAALSFDIKEIISDMALIVSGIITTWGVISADLISSESGAPIPNWTFLFIYLMLFILMKYNRQMAVHIGVSISGVAVSIGWFMMEGIPPIIGIVAGLAIMAFGLFFRVIDEWNYRVCIGFLIILALILGGLWALSVATDFAVAIATYLPATLGSIISAWGIVNIPPELEPPKTEEQKPTVIPMHKQSASEEEKIISADSESSLVGPKVFLSHQHEDKGFVRRLSRDLEKSGIQTWVDEAEILVGESLLPTISTAIAKKVDFFVAILSPKSVESGWVQRELELAMNKEIPTKEVFVLPILIETCTLPDYLTSKLYLDFRGDRYASQIKVLINHIKKHYSRKSD